MIPKETGFSLCIFVVNSFNLFLIIKKGQPSLPITVYFILVWLGDDCEQRDSLKPGFVISLCDLAYFNITYGIKEVIRLAVISTNGK